MSVVFLTLAALFTAVLSGMAGLGGGAILIATLFAVGMPPALALPLHAGVQLGSNASRSVVYAPHINGRALGLFLLTAIPGPFIVAPLVVDANPDWIRLVIAAFVAMGIWPSWAVKLRMHGRAGLLFAGLISGMLGPLVGATGILVAPFFLRDDWRKEQVIATMAAAQMCGHALKIAAFWANGYNVLARLDLLVPMVIAAIVGAVIGRQLVGFFSEARFRQLFRVILLLLSLKLAWDGASGLLA
ncbi:sulfite exporter TauE/SafE family protein [Salinisphaera aquimarina]|uniref:Probable membrane transporter protein n=1 Tax=Salinisphaera aquimarina TaxID=2094031 RepID=A0ABV7ET61_9GAMM